jgi:hypothetical protein
LSDVAGEWPAVGWRHAAAGEEEAKRGSLQPSSAVKPFRNQENEGDLISLLFFTLALELYEFTNSFLLEKLQTATWTLLNSLNPFGSTFTL